jgi:chaperonin GroEL (HSP60 family)
LIEFISVGGATAVEVKEKRDRVEDTLNATRTPGEGGVLSRHPVVGRSEARVRRMTRDFTASE